MLDKGVIGHVDGGNFLHAEYKKTPDIRPQNAYNNVIVHKKYVDDEIAKIPKMPEELKQLLNYIEIDPSNPSNPLRYKE
jgi:hypothetical protein